MFGWKKSGSTGNAPPVSAAEISRHFERETPDTAFVKAREQYFEMAGHPTVMNARLFIALIAVSVIAVCEAFAIYSMLPLQRIIPVVVKVNDQAGEVTISNQPETEWSKYKPERPVLDRELFNFVKNLYALNANAQPLVQEMHTAAYHYTRGQATAEFRDFLAKEQVYQRMKATPGLTRAVERRTMTYRDDANVVLIRFTTLERNLNQVDPILRPVLMQITYERVPPTERAELERNPLGIYVTHFEIQEDR